MSAPSDLDDGASAWAAGSTSPVPRDDASRSLLAFLIETAPNLERTDPRRAMECYGQAADLACQLGSSDIERHALRRRAMLQLDDGELAAADETLGRALRIPTVDSSFLEALTCRNGQGTLRHRQGRFPEALSIFRDVLARTTVLDLSGEAGWVRASALEGLGLVYRDTEQFQDSLRCFRDALELRRAFPDPVGIANDLDHVGILQSSMGDLDAAIQNLSDALGRFRVLEDSRRIAATANNLALVLYTQGDLTEARTLFLESRRILQSSGVMGGEARILTNLGLLATEMGEVDEAAAYIRDGLNLHREGGDSLAEAAALNNLAYLARVRGLPEEALGHIDRCLGVLRDRGSDGDREDPLFNRISALLDLGRIDAALEGIVDFEALVRRTESIEADVKLRLLRARVALVAGSEPNGAELEATLTVAEQCANPALMSALHHTLGRIHLQRSELGAAQEAFAAAATSFRRRKQPYERALLLFDEGVLRLRIGANEAAAERLRRAEREFKLLGNVPWRIRTLLVLADAVESADAAESASLRAGAASLANLNNWTSLLEPGRAGNGAPLASRDAWTTVERLTATALPLIREGVGSLDAFLELFGLCLREHRDNQYAILQLSPKNSKRWLRLDPQTHPCRYQRTRGEIVEIVVQGGGNDTHVDHALGSHPIGDPSDPFGTLLLLAGAPGASPATVDGGERIDRSPALGTALLLIAPALERWLERAESVISLAPESEGGLGFAGLIGRSASMRGVYRMLERAAPTDATVLVLGESGTGKELVARALHQQSKRSQGPFVAVNCPAIPRELIENELFGHEKGAYTSALGAAGTVERANGGTLFLDEIGDVPPAIQAKLLRFLQERTFQRVGGKSLLQANVRVIAATSRDLSKAIETGDFREDLYYRLNVVQIRMPSLREHREDIPLLVQSFLAEATGRIGRSLMASVALLDLLQAFDWPGNVRELRNVLESMATLSEAEVLTPAHLPEAFSAKLSPRPPRSVAAGSIPVPDLLPGATLDDYLQQIEAMVLRSTLGECGWNQSAAARRLGVTEGTIRNRIRKFGLRDPREAKDGNDQPERTSRAGGRRKPSRRSGRSPRRRP